MESSANFGYDLNEEVHFKETCPSVQSITVQPIAAGQYTSVMAVTLNKDTEIICHHMISDFTFEESVNVDTFVLSSKGYVTVEGESAFVEGDIRGSDIILKDNDMTWSEESGISNKIVTWTDWDTFTQSKKTTLTVDSMTSDTTFTCLFKVNERVWEEEVSIDVIQKTQVGTSVKEGSMTILTCGYSAAANPHSNVWWTSTVFQGMLSSIQPIAGYEIGGSNANGYTYTTIKVNSAASDATYTCTTDWGTNQISWQVKSDTFTISSSSKVTETGTTASLTCTIAGTDREPTGWIWEVAGVEYSASVFGKTISTSSFSGNSQESVLTLTSRTLDDEVTCKITIDGNQYIENIPYDVITITPVSRTVKEAEPVTLTCTVTLAQVAPTDIYWYIDNGATYKASTSTAGIDVVKSNFAAGTQSAELRIATAAADQTYTCKIEYPTNNFHKTATVDVFQLSTSQVTTQVPTGHPATFTCTVTQSKTQPMFINWKVDGVTANPADTNTYLITATLYSSETMKSTLIFKNIVNDVSVVCLTKVEFDASTPALQVDVYSLVPQNTLAFSNMDAEVVIKLTGLESDILKSRMKWYRAGNLISDGGLYTYSSVYDSVTKVWAGKLAMNSGAVPGMAKTTYKVTMDGIDEYSAEPTLDVAGGCSFLMP